MQPMIQISNPMVAGIVAAIVIGICAEAAIFRGSNPLAAIPALIAGYLVYRFSSWSGPFWLWFQRDGFIQLSVAVVIGACVLTAVWLLWNRIQVSQSGGNAADDPMHDYRIPFPVYPYHGTPLRKNADDINDIHRLLLRIHSR